MANNSTEFLAYLTHLGAEHRRLRDSVQRIDRQWNDAGFPQVAKVVAGVIDNLETLRAELAHHFEEEESGGCLEEAVSREPSLSYETSLLENEHPVLLAQVDRLIGKLKRASGGIQAIDETKEDFRRFVEQLHAHEEVENRILEESFGIDLE